MKKTILMVAILMAAIVTLMTGCGRPENTVGTEVSAGYTTCAYERMDVCFVREIFSVNTNSTPMPAFAKVELADSTSGTTNAFSYMAVNSIASLKVGDKVKVMHVSVLDPHRNSYDYVKVIQEVITK